MAGDDHCSAVLQFVTERLGDGEAVEPRHLQIQDRDIGLERSRHGQGFCARRSLGHHGQIPGEPEQGCQSACDELLVVGE